MHKLILNGLFFSATLLALFGAATNAFGADKAKKPVICTEYEVIRSAHRVVALCTDGKKPRLLVRFTEVTIPVAEDDTNVRKILVGYTVVSQ